MVLSIFSIPSATRLLSEVRQLTTVYENGTVNSGPIGLAGQSGSPPEVDLNMPVRTNRTNFPFFILTESSYIFGSGKHPG